MYFKLKLNKQFKKSFIFCVFTFLLNAQFLYSQNLSSIDLWTNGTGNYHTCRIPSLLVTKQGTLLAFCEGREAGGDAGDIDLLVKRSLDNGQTWSEEAIVWQDDNNTCGNPCPVVDSDNGQIWIFMTWNLGKDGEGLLVNKKGENTRRPFVCYSDDDGKTWSKPIEQTETCKNPSWGWYATGPGIGIQLKSERYEGRFVIPANHSYDDPEGNAHGGPFSYGSHVLLSDDHGKTWRKSEPITPGCNESQIVELADGILFMNMRSYNKKYCRAISKSVDGGETWSDIWHDKQLVESICQASIIHYGDFKRKSMFLFSNPAVVEGRTHMTIKTSFDDCMNWSNAKLIHAGPSAYSCLAKLQDGNIGLLFEYGKDKEYNKIRFISFPPEMLFTPGYLLVK